MTTRPVRPDTHETFEELAAGYALDALEPAEIREFETHLAGCAECQASVADFREVAGMLADVAPDVEPPLELASRLHASAAGDVGEVAGIAQVVALRPRRTRAIITSAAAALVLVAGGITSAVIVRGGSGSAACVAASGCHQVALVSSVGHIEQVSVDVQGVDVSVSPKHLSPNASGKNIYVLWQLTANQKPVAVAGFDVVKGVSKPIPVGELARPYNQTLAFAVSEEPGQTVPTTPSKILGVGAVTA
jgi:anti-sigma factor RsiW